MTHPLEHELLQHGKSLRLLARSLVGDQHADDLVQETALQALGAPSPPHSLRAFLRQILRHLAGKHHRGERHRREREAAVPPAEPPLPPDWIAAHRETLRRLDKALLSLPEPVLGTVLLRFFAALPPIAIAAKTGVPLPTVKSRLQRGLQLLRADLDGDGDDWRPALAAAFGLERATAAAITTGVLLMATGVKLAIAGAAAVFAVAATLYFAGGAPVTPPAAMQGATVPIAASTAADQPGAGPNAPAQAATPDRVAAPAPTAAEARTAIRGRCTDLHGNPLAGCTVRVTDARKPTPPPPEQVTGGDGCFELTCAPATDRVLTIGFTADGMVPVCTKDFALPHGTTKDLGDVALQHGVHLTGRVIDTLGAPCAALEVRLQWNGTVMAGLTYSSPRAKTAEDGSFDLGPWLAGRFEVKVGQARLLQPQSIEVADDVEAQRLEILVEARSNLPQIDGVVVDPHGMPLADAQVRACANDQQSRLDYTLKADAAGRFTFYQWDAGDGPPMHLTARLEGHESGRVRTPVAWGTRDARITLPDAMALEVTVVDDQGRPVEEFAVRMQAAEDGKIRSVHPAFMAAHAGNHPGGRLRIDGLCRSTYEFHVQPTDARLSPSPILHIDIDDPDPARLTVRLPAWTERVLQVATTTGAPVAGCRVELCQPYRSEVTTSSWAVTLSEWERYHGPAKSLLLQSGTTDARGELSLQGPGGANLCVRLLGPGCPPQVLAGVHLDDPTPLRCVVPAGGTLHVVAQHAEVLAEFAALNSSAPMDSKTAQQAPGLMLSRRVGGGYETVPDLDHPALAFGSDGTLTIPGVPPGRWRPSLRYPVGEAERWLTFDYVDLAEAQVTELRIDLTPLRPATLRGTVLCNGRPVARQTLWFEREEPPRPDGPPIWLDYRVPSEADGSFVLHGLPGRYRLNLHPDNVSGALRASPAALELLPGASAEQQFKVTTGSLRIRVVDGDGKPMAGVEEIRVQRAAHDWLDCQLPRSDADGRTSLPLCETGTFRLWLEPKRLGTVEARNKLLQEHPEDPSILERSDIDLGTVTVAAGEPVEQTVLLPAAYFQ